MISSFFFFLCTEWHFAAVGIENIADYSMVTKQTVGKGLPTSAEILASFLSEHVNEAQLAWRPLCPRNEEIERGFFWQSKPSSNARRKT